MSFVEGLVIIVLIVCLTLVFLVFALTRYSRVGKIVVKTDEEGIHYSLDIDGDPYDIQHMKNVSFKVVKEDNSTN